MDAMACDIPRRPATVRDGPRQSATVRDGLQRPAMARDGLQRPRQFTAARDGLRRPETARDGPRRPAKARDGTQRPATARDGPVTKDLNLIGWDVICYTLFSHSDAWIIALLSCVLEPVCLDKSFIATLDANECDRMHQALVNYSDHKLPSE
jgi:hypothetical protein